MEILTQQLINGLVVGAIYGLVALGYTMVYGVLELINFAHADIITAGVYVFVVLISAALVSHALSPFIFLIIIGATLLAMIVSVLIAVLVERLAYRPLRKAHRLAPLISALAASIFISNLLMVIFGTRNMVFPAILPDIYWNVLGAKLSLVQVFICVVAVMMMGILWYIVKMTKFGKAMRAIAQDPDTASLMGINVNKVIVQVFVLGASVGAVSGILFSMYYGIVHYSMSYTLGLKAFAAAILGGIGNIPGALLGGLVIGLMESFTSGFISSVYRDAIAFSIIVLLLILRPDGLLGTRTPDKL